MERLAEAEARIVHLEQSIRFRLGSLMLEAARNPLQAWRLWGTASKLIATSRKTHKWIALQEAIECGLPNDPVRGSVLPEGVRIKSLQRLMGVINSKPDVIKAFCAAAPSGYPAHLVARLNELAVIASDGLELRDAPLRQAQQGVEPPSDHIAYVLHTALPVTINGYALRSHNVIQALEEIACEVEPIIRATERVKAAHGYTVLPAFTPKDGSIEAYIHAYADSLTAVFEARRPKLVHAASNYITGLAAGIAAKRCRLPFVYEVRGLWEVTRLATYPDFASSVGFAVQERLETQAACLADQVLVISSALRGELVRRGVPAERISVAKNGALPRARAEGIERARARERYGLKESDVVFGFIGSITRYEGLDAVLDVLADKRLSGLGDVKLLIVGDGPHAQVLREQVMRMGVGDSVVFAGRVSPDDAQRAYHALDVAVYARPLSAVSSMVPPMKPLEAMANSVATVVSNVPAICELVGEGDHVAIVPAGDKLALADMLYHLAIHVEAREQLAREGRAWVTSNRTWKNTANCIKRAYDGALCGD